MADAPEGITVVTDTDVFFLDGRPCELSAFSHVPPNRLSVPKERNCFNSEKKVNNYADLHCFKCFYNAT